MQGDQVAELVIFIFCVLLLVTYNVLYFTKWFQNLRFRWRGHSYVNLWSVGLEARAVWAGAMMAKAEEGVSAAQMIRNMVLGVSVLTAATAVLVGQLILLLTDSVRLEQLRGFAATDPIVGGDSVIKPEAKLAIAMGTLFLSMLAMTQCVRLSVHLTYILRAIPADPGKRGARLAKIAFAINRRASLYFSIGLRLQYCFFPLFLYIIGPVALLVTTIVEVVALFLMDLTPDDISYQDEEDTETEEQVEHSIAQASRQASRQLTERLPIMPANDA